MVASYYCIGVGGGGGKGLLPLLCPRKLHVMPWDTHRFSAGLCFGRGYLPNQPCTGLGAFVSLLSVIPRPSLRTKPSEGTKTAHDITRPHDFSTRHCNCRHLIFTACFLAMRHSHMNESSLLTLTIYR